MPGFIKLIADGSKIEYDTGAFDAWCVYLKRQDEPRFAPKDLHYFTDMAKLGKLYGHERIYYDFVKIYNETTAVISQDVLDHITELAKSYGHHRFSFDTWFTVIYAGMVAEEKKEKAVLKKRIKRLGMYQLLMERRQPEYAANFSRGKKWRELDTIMKSCGF